MKKFEYQTLVISQYSDKEGFEAHINMLGSEGWELVSAFDFSKINFDNVVMENPYTSGFVLFFKREIASE